MKAFWYNEERKNLCGIHIRRIRKEKGISIQKLAIMAELAGHEFLTANVITKIELGIRFVPDYEVLVFSELLEVSLSALLTPYSVVGRQDDGI